MLGGAADPLAKPKPAGRGHALARRGMPPRLGAVNFRPLVVPRLPRLPAAPWQPWCQPCVKYRLSQCEVEMWQVLKVQA